MKDVRRALLTMWVMAGLVLVVACLNFANLLTARATARQQELAVRASLGGRRLRLARQLVVEALVLVGIGGMQARRAAHIGAGLLVAALPQPFLGAGGVRLDARVIGFALGASPPSAAWCSPSCRRCASRRSPSGRAAPCCRLANPCARTPGRAPLTHRAPVAAGRADALTLLVGAALFVKSFWQLARIEPGYPTRATP